MRNTILSERLERDFIDAAYGYWIAPTGEIINVEDHGGHVETLETRFEFLHMDDDLDMADWYNEALSNGWVRIIAPNHNFYQFNFQFKILNAKTRRALIDLLEGLPEYGMYYYEAIGHKSFPTARDAINFVRSATGTAGMTTETWKK